MNATSNFVASFRGAFAKAQSRAGSVLTKGSDFCGEIREIAGGNVKAVAESGKILNAGFKAVSLEMILATRASVEISVKDLRRLASVQTPSELIALRTEIATRNLDNVADFVAMQSDAARALTKSAIAPISDRLTIAAEKIRSAAA